MTRGTKSFIAGLALAFAVGGPARAQGDDAVVLNKYKMLEARMTKVRKFFQAESYAKCEAEAAACLKDLPGHHEAHFFLGQVHYKGAEFDKALAEAAAAETGYLRFKRITDAIQSKKLTKQLAEKEDLVSVAEAWEDAYDNGVCRKFVYKNEMERTREQIEADGKYGETALTNTDAPVPAEYRYFHGNCLFRLKDFAGAEVQYRAALRMDPRHANAATNLINLLYIQKRIDEARAALAQAEANRVDILPGLKKAVLDAAGK